MTDEERMTADEEMETPEQIPEPEPPPEPEEPAAPVEVITVEDLLDRLTGDGEEAPPSEGAEEAPDFTDTLPDAVIEDGPIEVVGMDVVLKRLEVIQQTEDHPALTTPFADYTVTEGLLLLLFLSAFLAACWKMLKGGFAWLR